MAISAKRLREYNFSYLVVKLIKTQVFLFSSQASERGEFVKLRDQLETFESGKMQLEDHYSKLMNSLQNNRNKIRLLDRRQVWVFLRIKNRLQDSENKTIKMFREVIKQGASTQLLTQTTAKGAAISKRIQRLTDLREKQEVLLKANYGLN